MGAKLSKADVEEVLRVMPPNLLETFGAHVEKKDPMAEFEHSEEGPVGSKRHDRVKHLMLAVEDAVKGITLTPGTPEFDEHVKAHGADHRLGGVFEKYGADADIQELAKILFKDMQSDKELSEMVKAVLEKAMGVKMKPGATDMFTEMSGALLVAIQHKEKLTKADVSRLFDPVMKSTEKIQKLLQEIKVAEKKTKFGWIFLIILVLVAIGLFAYVSSRKQDVVGGFAAVAAVAAQIEPGGVSKTASADGTPTTKSSK
eukprot:m.20374 g.20374  ORF g.20374 m.20374 type:complete len:258 (+) comp10195_c0_seq1:25-798(+)